MRNSQIFGLNKPPSEYGEASPSLTSPNKIRSGSISPCSKDGTGNNTPQASKLRISVDTGEHSPRRPSVQLPNRDSPQITPKTLQQPRRPGTGSDPFHSNLDSPQTPTKVAAPAPAITTEGGAKRPKSASLIYVISTNPEIKPKQENSGGIDNAPSVISSNSRPSSAQASNLPLSQYPQASGKGIAYFRFANKIKRLGISRNHKSSVSFERILEGNWSEIDRIFIDKYHLRPVGSVHFRPRQKSKKSSKGQIHDEIFEEVAEAVELVCREANRKRRKLRTLCLENPYLPCVYKNYVMVTFAVEDILSECFTYEHERYAWLSWVCILSMGMIPMLIALFLLLGLLFGTLVGFVWDMFTLRYFLRFSGYEQRWIRALLMANPDLDTFVIETALKQGLQNACDALMKKVPNSDLRVWAGIERFDHWNIFCDAYHEFKEEFFIIINPPSESFGQLLYHF
jgi:hypothetical protein